MCRLATLLRRYTYDAHSWLSSRKDFFGGGSPFTLTASFEIDRTPVVR
jgi:hypothetical protein